MEAESRNPEDTLNVLVATDIHLGYNELDPIRGDDSFNTFEEILQYAVEHNVDFILLAGDLFHDAKPSPNCLLKCTRLFKKYCFGSKPIEFEIFSNQNENFKQTLNGLVNYEDPNINISFPVFSIHGNHDDPIGRGAVSSLDILSHMGLVNYFGKWTDYSQITISPILMKKGKTNIGLYGLSFLKDQRLARLFREGKVKVQKLQNDDTMFNIFTLHQNRVDRGLLNYIPEEVLPDFMDLVIWGHEHDCRIEPEWNATKNFFVSQPGSPVATSLAHGEALPKHCGLLQIHEKNFKMFKLKLKTVRPFVFEVIVLSEVETLNPNSVDAADEVQEYLKLRVNEALMKADEQRSGHSNQPQLPLIRFCVLYEQDNQQFNVIRFGQQFSDSIANPQDLILLKKEKVRERNTAKSNINKEALSDFINETEAEEISVETLLEKYYKDRPATEQLKMLSVKCLGEAVISFTQKGDTEAISEVIKYQKKQYLDHLMKFDIETEEDALEHMSVLKQQFDDENGDKLASIKKILQETATSGGVIIDMDNSSGDDEPLVTPDAKPTRGRGRGRGSRGPRGSRGGRGASIPATNTSTLNITHDSSSNSSASNNWLTNLSKQSVAPKQTPKRNAKKSQYYD